MPGQETAQGLDHFWSIDRPPGSHTNDWTATEAFSSMGHYVSVPFSPSLHTAGTKPYFFLLGLVETSQSDQKWLLETEKDYNQTKSSLFLKSSDYVNLYEKFTLHLSVLEYVALESIWIWMFSVTMCVDAVYQITYLRSSNQSYVFPV